MSACGYHFSAKPISRSAGQSAVASASYRTGEALHDNRLNKTFDYTRKQGVEFVYHAAPKNAPDWAQEIGAAWNMLEQAETKQNANLALDYSGAFPHQLNAQQREYVLKDFVREEFTRKGFMATAVIHSPSKQGDARNHHAHIMFSYRALGENGFAKNKDRRFSSFDSRAETLDHLKERWAELGARQLERAGFKVEAERWRHGHRTLPEQRDAALARGDIDYARQCNGEATKHLGPLATVIERDGRESYAGNENREIDARNRERGELPALAVELRGVEGEIADLQPAPPRLADRFMSAAGKVKDFVLPPPPPPRTGSPEHTASTAEERQEYARQCNREALSHLPHLWPLVNDIELSRLPAQPDAPKQADDPSKVEAELAALERALTLQPTEALPPPLDSSVEAFLARQAAERSKPGFATREAPSAAAAVALEKNVAKGFKTAATATGRAAGAVVNVADRFMSAAADFLVGAVPSLPRTGSARPDLETAAGRQEYIQQKRAEEARTAALDRLRETHIAGRIMDTGELAHLNPADLQSVKDRGEAALLDLIRMRERELERKRSRGGRER